jgi:hypothetical protein
MGIVDVTHKLVAQERERERARERRKTDIQRERERQKQGEKEKEKGEGEGEATPASVFQIKKNGGGNEKQRGPRVRLSWGRDAFKQFDVDASGMLDAHELGVCVCVLVKHVSS